MNILGWISLSGLMKQSRLRGGDLKCVGVLGKKLRCRALFSEQRGVGGVGILFGFIL